MGAEDELVASTLPLQPGFEPMQTMLREHAELHTQLSAIEECFAEAAPGALPEAWELEPYVAILSGTLAKHEHREEQGVFPLWAACLAGRSQREQDALLEAVRDRLGACAAGPRRTPPAATK